MELCYEGGLVMPSSYAMMDEEEMTYVEGGFRMKNWIVGGAINVLIGLMFGGVSFLSAKAAAGYFVKAQARKLFAKNLSRQLLAKGVACSIVSTITSVVPTVLTFIGEVCDPGGCIAQFADNHDRVPGNGYIDV